MAQGTANSGGQQSLATLLSESPHFPLLQELGIGRIAELLETAGSNITLASALETLEFRRLVRLARSSCRFQALAERMQNLALPQVINLFATATDTAAGVARLKALGFENLLYFYEYAIRDAGFAGYLELFHFPAIVASIEAEFYSGQPVRNLSRIDLYRLRRLLFAMLGAERLAGGEKSLDARNVLTLRTKGVPLPQPMFKQMEAEPHRFDFFASMRALQVAFSRWPKIGASISLSEDYARMRQEPDMAFAPRTIRSFKFGEPDHPEVPSIISVNFLGLFGPNGPLPLHFTDYVLSRLREGDAALATFADVFQHRSLTFFFRAWAVHQKTVDLDRPEESRFANYIASFIGLGMPSLRDRDAVPDMAKLYFSGRLACSQRNPEGLAAILSEYFGVPCEILSFVGHWITIPESDSCRLGDSPASGTLGVSAIIGSRVFQYQTKFRVRLGPMRLADLQRLLPGQLSWKQLQAWVANYIGHEFLWDAQYVLLADEVPQTQLGSGSMLGWTTWIITRKPGHDVDDVILDSDLY